MPPRRNVADVIGGRVSSAAARFRPLFELLRSNKAESEADNFARGIKLLELDFKAKASTRATRQLDISGRQATVAERNVTLREDAAAVVKPLTTAEIEAKVASGTATPEEIAGLTQLRSIKTAKPGAVDDVSKTIPDFMNFQKREASLKRDKAAFESKQALLPDRIFNREKIDPATGKAGIWLDNLEKTAPWPGSLPTAADSVRAVRTTAAKHNVPVEEVVEAWSGIEPAFEKLFQESKRSAIEPGILQQPIGRSTAGIGLSRAAGLQGTLPNGSGTRQAVRSEAQFRAKYLGWDALTEAERQELRQAEQ